jgi:hypothetical protein
VPIHVVYGGSDRFKADTLQKLGKIALKSLRDYTLLNFFTRASSCSAIDETEILEKTGLTLDIFLLSSLAQIVEIKQMDFA